MNSYTVAEMYVEQIEEKRDNLIRIEKETNKSLNKNNQKIKVLEENM